MTATTSPVLSGQLTETVIGAAAVRVAEQAGLDEHQALEIWTLLESERLGSTFDALTVALRVRWRDA